MAAPENHDAHTLYINPDEYEFFHHELQDHDHPDIRSPIDGLVHYTEADPTYPFLGERAWLPNGERGEYEWISYGQVLETGKALARALLEMGLQKGDVVGFFSCRRLEWHYLFVACGFTGIRLLTLYESLSADAIRHIHDNAQMKRVFISIEKLAFVQQTLDVPLTLIEEEHEPTPIPETITSRFYRLLARGRELDTPLTQTTPDDVAVMVYTSGTTGMPKGVALTYRNLSASSSSLWMRVPLYLLQDYPRQCRKLRSMSFLPLGHVFAIVMECVMYRVGGSIGFMSSTHLKILEDIEKLRPVVFAAVPRVLQIIYAGVNEQVAKLPAAVQAIFHGAIKLKQQILRYNPTAITTAYDRAIFGRVKEKFGGELRIIICAGAPLSLEIAQFFRTVLADGFFIGYGMTETTGMGLSTVFENGLDLDHVGKPYISSQVKVRCVPEMGYCTHNAEPSGEILIKTTGGFTGYYKDDGEGPIDSEGYIATQDIVVVRPDGLVKIVARKNNVFKLSQGEYVSAEKVESFMMQSKFVQDIFVYGNSVRNYLIAVVVPNFVGLAQWAKTTGKTLPADQKEVCQMPEVNAEIVKDMTLVADACGLKGFEKVRKVILHEIPFDTERDFITPSLKLKRQVLQRFFQEQIDALYAE